MRLFSTTNASEVKSSVKPKAIIQTKSNFATVGYPKVMGNNIPIFKAKGLDLRRVSTSVKNIERDNLWPVRDSWT